MNINDLSTAEERLKYEDAVFVKTKGASMRPLINSKKDVAVLKKADKSPKKNSVVYLRKTVFLSCTESAEFRAMNILCAAITTHFMNTA